MSEEVDDNGSNEDKLLHRDDLPMDVAEGIVSELQRLHPGCVVRFAGDGPVPPEALEAAKKRMAQIYVLLDNGQCMDCGTKMPNWPAKPENMDDDWQPAPGWKHFTDTNGDIVGWQCPECDAKDEAR